VRPSIIVRTIYCLSLVIIFFMTSSLQAQDTSSLNKTVVSIIKDLVKRGGLAGNKVVVSSLEFYEMESKLSLPLALLLREKSISALAKEDVRVILPGPGNMNEMSLQGLWRREGQRIYLSFKVIVFPEDGSPEVVVASDGSIQANLIDSKLLKPDIDSWGRY
jgi:hypothetical protein